MANTRLSGLIARDEPGALAGATISAASANPLFEYACKIGRWRCALVLCPRVRDDAIHVRTIKDICRADRVDVVEALVAAGRMPAGRFVSAAIIFHAAMCFEYLMTVWDGQNAWCITRYIGNDLALLRQVLACGYVPTASDMCISLKLCYLDVFFELMRLHHEQFNFAYFVACRRRCTLATFWRLYAEYPSILDHEFDGRNIDDWVTEMIGPRPWRPAPPPAASAAFYAAVRAALSSHPKKMN